MRAEVKYDTPIEVTKSQYLLLSRGYSDIVAYRTDENGKYFVKLMLPKYKNEIQEILDKTL